MIKARNHTAWRERVAKEADCSVEAVVAYFKDMPLRPAVWLRIDEALRRGRIERRKQK